MKKKKRWSLTFSGFVAHDHSVFRHQVAVDALQGDEFFRNPSFWSKPHAESDVVVFRLELPLECGSRIAHFVLDRIHRFLLHRYLGEVRVCGETPAGSRVVRTGHIATHIHLYNKEKKKSKQNALTSFMQGTARSRLWIGYFLLRHTAITIIKSSHLFFKNKILFHSPKEGYVKYVIVGIKISTFKK